MAKLDSNTPIEPLDVVGFMSPKGLSSYTIAFMLGGPPTEISKMSKSEPGDKINDLSRALLTRLYSEHPYLLDRYLPVQFAALLNRLKEFIPDITANEVAELLGATKQNGSRWNREDIDIKRPKLIRMSQVLIEICDVEGKEGIEAAIEEIRKEYDLQKREHSIRSVKEMHSDPIMNNLVQAIRKHLPSITEKEIAILCGATKPEKDTWLKSVHIYKQEYGKRAQALLTLSEKKTDTELCSYINKRIDEITSEGLEGSIRPIEKLKE